MCGVLAVASIALLAGCTASATDEVLASGDAAIVPASATSDLAETIVDDSLRRLGEDSEGHTYYVAEAADPATGLCILIDGLDDGPVLGCGAMPLTVSSGGVSARLSINMTPVDSGERIGDFLVVHP